MSEITLIFPHQLFAVHPALSRQRPVYLIEDALFFSQYPFHLKKIVLHRASMHAYEDELRKKGYQVTYTSSAGAESNLETLFRSFSEQTCHRLHIADPVDYLLRRRLLRFASKYGMEIRFYNSPNFLNSMDELNEYFNGRKKYFLTDFYIDQRKKERYSCMTIHRKGVNGPLTWKTEKNFHDRFLCPPFASLGSRMPSLIDLQREGANSILIMDQQPILNIRLLGRMRRLHLRSF
jgi:deoxyribodipyrimidine photolyase-related protein